jgi:AcrR family transcriptional regulator
MARPHGSTNETKKKILDAYLSLCAEIGITQVTLQRVAKKSKLSFTTVRYHFAEHSSGLEYEASMYVAQAGQRFTQTAIDNARKKKSFNTVKSYIDATFDWLESFPDQAKFLIYFYYVSGTKQNLPIRNDSLVETARIRTASLIHEAIGRGEVKKTLDVIDLAPKIHAILYGCGVLAMSIGSMEEYKRSRRICWEMIQKLLS